MIPKGEYVFRKGEIATEMYFIIEGTAVVELEDKEGNIIKELNIQQGNFFGEMAIIDLKASLRGAAIKAKEELYLGCLYIEDLKTIFKYY